VTTFSMRGNTEKKLHGDHSAQPVEITGQFVMSGPQPVSALPEWVVKAFDEIPEIMLLAINTDTRGVVYRRMESHQEENE